MGIREYNMWASGRITCTSEFQTHGIRECTHGHQGVQHTVIREWNTRGSGSVTHGSQTTGPKDLRQLEWIKSIPINLLCAS